MEMNEHLSQIEHLLTLFEERDQVIQYSTYQIFELIRPTVLEALCELFEVPFEEVEWGDVEYAEGIIIIVCAVWYNVNTTSLFLREVFKDNDVPVDHARYIRIGFPITQAFASKESIIDFLTSTPPFGGQESSVDIPQRIKDNIQAKFDMSSLTEEQKVQLVLSASAGKGIKH